MAHAVYIFDFVLCARIFTLRYGTTISVEFDP